MVLKQGSIIGVNEFLAVGDYIQSPSSLYYAIMQGDGNFCIYRGTGPEDEHGYLWSSKKTGSGGKFFAMMQDDGNFSIYEGTGPDDRRKNLWNSGKTDPVADYEIREINYELDKAEILSQGKTQLDQIEWANDDSESLDFNLSETYSVEEVSSWSDSLKAKVGVETNFKVGIPIFADGKVKVSVEVENMYTWSGSTKRTKSWTVNQPIKIRPRMKALIFIKTSMSTISVPYTLEGTLIFNSGDRWGGEIKGRYNGSNSHDITAEIRQIGIKDEKPVETITLPLKATSTYRAAS